MCVGDADGRQGKGSKLPEQVKEALTFYTCKTVCMCEEKH